MAQAAKPGAPQAKRQQDDRLDDALEDTFPASDPPQTTAPGGTKAQQAEEAKANHGDAHHHGEHAPKAAPTGDRHAAETAAGRQNGVDPAEAKH